MNFTAQTYWELINIPTTGRLTARFNARIGKQDVLLFAGGLPETFKEAYPFRPLVIHAGTEGNLKQMQISRFTAELPGGLFVEWGRRILEPDRQCETQWKHGLRDAYAELELLDRTS